MTDDSSRADSPAHATQADSGKIAILTLGMHRSGTSALSGVLARLGCDAPATLMPPDARNTKGFYESYPISALNNRILASAGNSWDDWSSVAPAWFDSPRRAQFADEALDLIGSEFSGSPLIVLKDPRISLLAPFWFDVLARAGYRVKVVFAVRRASEVAASLTDRNGFDPALGRLIWLRYVLDGERASRHLPRVFVTYDRLLSDWSTQVARIEAGLDLRLPRQSALASSEVESFLTPSLRHFASPGSDDDSDARTDLPWFQEVQGILESWSSDNGDAGDQAILDRIREEVDTLVPAFDPLVRAARERPKSESARASVEAECEELRNELHLRAEVLFEHEQKVDELIQSLGLMTRENAQNLEKLQAATRDAEGARAAEAHAKAAAEHASAELHMVRHSRSYRLMSPLRRVAALLRR